MALKPLNSPGGFSVGEISTGAINVISSTGNVTTGNIVGTNNGNVNLVGNLILDTGSNLSTGNLTASGNVTGAYILGNGAFLTGLPEAYGNANVANYLPTYSGNISAGNISVTSNAVINGTLSVPNDTSTFKDVSIQGQVLNDLAVQGNVNPGNVNASGNVSGSYLLGNGYFITGIQYSNIIGAYGNSDVNSYLGSNANIAILTTGNITTAANISGNYILGNGAFLTSINAGNIVGGYGNANVKAYLESGSMINANFDGGSFTATGVANLGPTTVNGNLVVSGNISATGNITYINVQDLVVDDPLIQLAANNPGDVEDIGIVGGYNDGIAKHTGVVRDYTDGTWKVFANVTSEPNTVINWSQAVYAPFKAGPILSNASITANANVTATGNVSGSYLLGNGYFITGIQYSNIAGAYGNSNVAAYLPTYTGNLDSLTGNVITTANISGSYILGNGAFLTGMYSNLNVANYLPTYTGNVGAGNLNLTGNIVDTGALSIITGAAGNISLAPNGTTTFVATTGGANVTGNLDVTGNISAGNFIGTGANTTIAAGSFTYTFDNVGNVTLPGSGNLVGGNTVSANFFLGNGSLLTGMYSNLNVANYLPTYTGNVGAGNLNLTGNIVDTGALQIVTGASGNIGLAPNGSNTAVISTTGVTVTGTLSATGNITGGNLSGTLVTGTLTTAAQPNITSVGTLTSLDVTGNVTSSGNVSGNYLLGNGAFITGLPAGYSNADVANYLASNSAVTILTTGSITTSGNVTANNFTGTGSNTTIRSNGYSWVFDSSGNLTTPVAGTITGGNLITANYFSGDGSLLTNINAGNILGGYGNANVKAYLESGATINANFGTGTVTTTGNITGGNIGGALVSGTLTTAAQPNITTVGTLVSLDVSANITAGGLQMSTANATIGNLYVTGNTTIAGNITQISGNSGQFFGNAATGFNALYAGLPAGFTLLPQSVMNFVSSFNGYSQVNNQNQNGGDEATVDYVLTGNNGDDETYYFDIGYTSSGFDGAIAGANNAIGTAAETNDAYMYTTANVAAGQIGNLILATVDTGSQIRFVVGGRDMGNTAFRINSPNTVSANSISGTVTVQGDAGISGNINAGGYVSATGNVSGGNLTTAGQIVATGNITGGNLSGTLVTGTLTTAAQPNITSLGTLSVLDVTGNITSLSGNISGNYLLGNGAFITGLPAGYSNADVTAYLASSPNINITLGNSNSNITTGGTIRTYGTSIANNFIANNYLELQAASSTAVREQAYTTTTTGTSLATIATIPVAGLPSSSQALEVTIRGVDGNNTQAGKMLVTWNAAGASDYTRYGEIILGTGCGTVSATYNGTDVLVQVTSVSSNSTVWTAKVVSI